MSKQKLVDRLSWYYPLEKLHAFLTFPGLMIYLILKNPFSDIVFLIYGLLVCNFILLQGQHYWKLKLQRLTHKQFDQEPNIRLFKKAKKVNSVLIALIPLVLLFQLSLYNWSIPVGNLFMWAICANCFAILEHINYYYIQLMVDNKSDLSYVLTNKRFKIASLKKDLSEGEI